MASIDRMSSLSAGPASLTVSDSIRLGFDGASPIIFDGPIFSTET